MAFSSAVPGTGLQGLLAGLESGNKLMDSIMHPILERERQKQLEEHFRQEMEFKKKQEARMGANSGLNRQLLQQQINSYELKNNPQKLFEFIQKIKQQSSNGMLPQGQQQIPTNQEMNLFGGNGMPNMQEIGNPKNQHPQEFMQNTSDIVSKPQQSGGIFDNLTSDQQAMLQMAGIKIPKVIENPKEKRFAQLQDKLALEEYKAQQKKILAKGGSNPTNAVLTLNQNAVQGIDTVLPMLDELITSKNIPGILDFSPGKKAAYNAKTSGMIDTLIVAQGLPKVQASIDLVEEQIRRKSGETVFDYQKRLKDLKKDLLNRRKRAQFLLTSGKINTIKPEDFSSMSDEDLARIAGGG
jgi:hypothetical protein